MHSSEPDVVLLGRIPGNRDRERERVHADHGLGEIHIGVGKMDY